MQRLRDRASASGRARRGALWCLATGIAWAMAAIWPEPDWRAIGLLLGVAAVGGVQSDLIFWRDPGVAGSLSNAAALLLGAGVILLARFLLGR